jgi:hypothetical protein
MKWRWPWVSRKRYEREVATLKVRLAGLTILNNKLLAGDSRDAAARGRIRQELDALLRLRKANKKGGYPQ